MTKYDLEELAVLKYAELPEIPAAAGEKTPVWIDAVAKIKTMTGRDSFAVVRQVEYGKSPKVRKAFNDEGIGRIVSVHPYKFLDGNFVPSLENAAATKRYIAQVYGVDPERVSKLKKEELSRLFYTHCIKAQLEYEKEQSKKLDI